jgi:hypothetical protein
MAAQLMVTKAPLRPLARCRASAWTSFPTPVSPVSSTSTLVRAKRRSLRASMAMAGERVGISAKGARASSCSASSWSSVARRKTNTWLPTMITAPSRSLCRRPGRSRTPSTQVPLVLPRSQIP